MIRIVFFGTELFATEILRALFAMKDATVVGVITQPARRVGRKQELHSSPVSQLAAEANALCLEPATLKSEDIQRSLQEFNADIFIVAQYGLIIPQAILSIPHYGALNVHTSLLPLYRGASPVQSAIAAGEIATGITIMCMDAQLDHGSILTQYPAQISPTDTTPTLMARLAAIGSAHIGEVITQFVAGSLTPQPQIEALATFTKLLSREDGFVDFKTETATSVERKIRALTPWPGVTIAIGDLNVKLLSASVMAAANQVADRAPGALHISEDRVFFATYSGTLEVLTLQPAGKSVMTAANFARGYKHLTGTTAVQPQKL